jgi:hypothetical protein
MTHDASLFLSQIATRFKVSERLFCTDSPITGLSIYWPPPCYARSLWLHVNARCMSTSFLELRESRQGEASGSRAHREGYTAGPARIAQGPSPPCGTGLMAIFSDCRTPNILNPLDIFFGFRPVVPAIWSMKAARQEHDASNVSGKCLNERIFSEVSLASNEIPREGGALDSGSLTRDTPDPPDFRGLRTLHEAPEPPLSLPVTHPPFPLGSPVWAVDSSVPCGSCALILS